jgi:hypothetical protein
MKRIIVAVFIAAIASTHAGLVASLDDIELWAGTGVNRSALVVDFHDGNTRESFVWGFRWSGSATGFDMLTAIDSAWTELTLDNPSFVNSITYVEGIVTHLQSANWVTTSWGYYLAGGTATQFDSNPPYGAIGTLSVTGGGLSLPTSWTISPAGSSDRFLANGSWDALSFGTFDTMTYEHQTPPSSNAYAAIPEPSIVALFVLGAAAVAFYAQKRLYSC